MDVKGWKTILMSGFVALVGFLAKVGMPLADEFVTLITNNIEIFLMVIGGIFAFLRKLTSTPIFKG